ncbi:MAG TPA: TraR/DksA C4-type zinc finger protein [Methylomirabilota bacterium]
MVTEGRLDPDTSSEFRQILRDARGHLLRRVSVMNNEVQGLTNHESGAFNEDSASAVTADLLERIGGHERHELDEIRAAQARLETGSFGVCETCGSAIHLSRLRAVPWTRHCLACQSQEEGRP